MKNKNVIRVIVFVAVLVVVVGLISSLSFVDTENDNNNSHDRDEVTETISPDETEDPDIITETPETEVVEPDETEPNHVHIFENYEIEVEATCLKTGVKKYICSTCEAYKTETIPKLTTHDYGTGKVTAEATCAKEGIKTFTCSICGKTKTETIAKLSEHTWNEGVVTKEATCSATGTKTFICNVCNTTKIETIAKLDHELGIQYSTGNYSYYGNGWHSVETKRSCSNCDYYEIQWSEMAECSYGAASTSYSAVDSSQHAVITSQICSDCGHTENSTAYDGHFLYESGDSQFDSNDPCLNYAYSYCCDCGWESEKNYYYIHSFNAGTCSECGAFDPDYSSGGGSSGEITSCSHANSWGDGYTENCVTTNYMVCGDCGAEYGHMTFFSHFYVNGVCDYCGAAE